MMRKVLLVATTIWVGAIGLAHAATPPPPKVEVHPWLFDPGKTDLVSSAWVKGLGCQTGGFYAPYPSTVANTPYSDPGCPTRDPSDQDVNGLVLGKQGPTNNNAAGGASVKYSPNTSTSPLFLNQIGYDLRTETGTLAPNSLSHCGFGAPRFNIVTTTGNFYFLGCGNPTGTITASSAHWQRMQWGDGTAGSVQGLNPADGWALEYITDPIKSIDLVFDEGSDQGTGIAILDNINVNGTLGGH